MIYDLRIKKQELSICKRTERRYSSNKINKFSLRKVFHLASGFIARIEPRFWRASLAVCGNLAILIIILSVTTAPAALAQTMSNSNYTIRMGNLNSIAGEPSGSGFKLLYTSGQTGAGLYSGTNFKVRAGFEYIKSIIPFRFTVSSIFIDFGPVSPTIPVLRTNQLTISNGSAFGYQVTTSQDHNLRLNAKGIDIPATACNGGGSGNCTVTTAALWNDSLTYGFGYRCTNINGSDCDTQFATTDYYKPFISSPSAVIVMSGHNVGRNKVVEITYKLNIAGSQIAGLYTNVINYIATPTF